MAVLTFHSISAEPGPTSIDAATFRMQMDVLAEAGFASMTCQDFLAWHEGRANGGTKRVLITFDDGFADFATVAFPILRERSFSCMVFVPTGKLGKREDWPGANASPRPLMTWSTLSELARAGVEFGGHGITHADLTRLAPDRRREEIERCAQDLAERIGRRTRGFATPYGHVNSAVRVDLARTYDVAFGTRFEYARPACDLFDVPRIEMHYFRKPRHWRAFVLGRRSYFLARRALRAVKNAGIKLLNV
ncbi:MAG: polysaccharide deacetylase family protein [Pseudomonadota bacterium]|nr:polysaccharide deacetylase family protein [Pseudomonadota bacterium]